MNFDLKMKRKILITLQLLVLLTIIVGVIYYFFFYQREKIESKKISEQSTFLNQCLDGDKVASYKIEEKESPLVDMTIYINDKNTERELFSFKIDNLFKTSTSIELHKCGIYVIKEFNFDFKNFKPLPGFSVELWRYQYNAIGKKFLELAGENIEGKAGVYYNYDFRVSPNEKYIVLEKGYLGKEGYSLVIKNLKTKEDVFTLSADSISKQYPNLVGNFNMREWSGDGRYFWGDIFDGAYVNGYFRIDTTNWKADIFEAPGGAMGGDVLNPNTGYVTVHPGNVWLGFAELTEEEKEKRREKGIGTEFYIHNLITGKRYFVDKTDEPLWYFQPRWISDTELEYYLPSEEKRGFVIK